MNFRLRPAFLLTMLCALFLTMASPALADGWIETGQAVRTKSVIITVNVYAIRHDMKERPATKSKQAVIDADVDKKFTWMMLRSVSSEKIKNALREAFAQNGYGDKGKIEQFVAAFSKDEVSDKSPVVITYNATAKTTTIWVKDGSSATVAGADFMKGVWRIWFGKIDQPSMGDQLISKL